MLASRGIPGGANVEFSRLGSSLQLARCPHCSIANPMLYAAWPTQVTPRADGAAAEAWAAFACTSCGSVVTARCHRTQSANYITELYPPPIVVDEELPETAKRFLQQAHETQHAPDAAAVMAGSAVDAMLKHLGLKEGSVYKRIEQAVEANILTKAMGEWAHFVRLGSNRPRHADAESAHVTPEEAKQSIEFATALGQFLFVLTARVERGIESAKDAVGEGGTGGKS
jgi:predicted RNA-binding Zn-ribbon protein involved in translation (DUF1610 family)